MRKRKITWVLGGPNSDCHICTSHALGRDGYPKVWRDGKTQQIHRYLYKQQYGELADDELLVHNCGVPSCINFAHIIKGNGTLRSAGMVTRGRSTKGLPCPSKGMPRGHQSFRAVTIDCEAVKTHTGSCAVTAKVFGISSATVHRIRAGRHWSQE